MGYSRDGERIRREAADWRARLGGEAEGETRAEFRRWYQADPRHAETYDRIDAIWSAAGRLSAPATVGQAGWRFFRIAPGLSIAALLVAGLALALLVLLRPPWLPGAAGAQRQVFEARDGEIRRVALPDGSWLLLDSGSRVETRFDATQRRLALGGGRARFIVAHESRPFVVRAGASEVVATGTIFDMRLAGGRLAVVMIQGTVEVRADRDAPAADAQRLEAGQGLEIAPGGAAVRRPARRTETMWPSGMLVFDDTPLREAVRLVNREGSPRLGLGSPRLGDLRVTGAYRSGDVRGFAASLAAAFRLRLDETADGSLWLVDPAAPVHVH